MTEMQHEIAVRLEEVWVQYRVRNAHHYNMKRSVTNAIAGRREDAEVVTALGGVNLSVPKGARLGVVGANGAGKSTLLSVMAGTLRPTRGRTAIDGKVLALLGGPSEGLDPEQTGRENALHLGVRLGERSDEMNARLDDIREFSGLGQRFDHPVYTYSSGMQVRLRFSTITSLKADILLIDEGLGAADSEFNERAATRLSDFYQSAKTLVLASHSSQLLGAYTTEVLEMRAGCVER